MNIVIIILIVIALLFLTAYFTKRRFGVLGLALCAGSLLSAMWAADLTPFIREYAGVQLIAPPLANVVSVCLVLLPAVLLLFSGPSYHTFWQRALGAAAFALLATSLVLQSLGAGLMLDPTGKQVYDFLLENRNIIITAAIAYALFDLLMLKTPKKKDAE